MVLREMRVVGFLLLGVVLLAVLMAWAGGGGSGMLGLVGGDPVCRYTGRVGEGVYSGEFVVLLASPSRSAFSVYLSNGEEWPVVARVYAGERLLFEERVLPGRTSILGKIVFERGGYEVVRVSIDRVGFPCGLELRVAASGGSGLAWAGYLLVVGLFVFLARGVVRGWLPGLVGLSLFPAYAYFHGVPRPVAVDLFASFGAYYGTMLGMVAGGIVSIFSVMAIVVGVFSAYYPRGGGWDSGEALSGKWGPRIAARRLLLGSLVLSLTVLSSFLVFLLIDGMILSIAVAGFSVLKVLLLDLACLMAVSLGLGLLFSGVAFAARSPLLAVVLGLLLVLTVLQPRCVLGLIGFSEGATTTGSPGVAIDIGTKMNHFIPILERSAAMGIAGVVAWLAGWLRR